LIASTELRLRKALKVAEEWAKQWRFAFNAAKCGIMTTANEDEERVEWYIADGQVNEVTQYKYLGAEVHKKGTWNDYVERIVSKGRKRLFEL
jgi:hypothetical protein